MLSVFFNLVWLEHFWKSKELVFNALVNEYILVLSKIQIPPAALILWKFHNSSFYTTSSGIYACKSWRHDSRDLCKQFWSLLHSNLIIKVLFVCFCFCLIAKLLEFNSFVVVFLAIKIKKYLHVSYKHLFDYLRIVKYTENENLKPWYFSQHHKRLITCFCNLKKGIYWVRNQWGKCNKLHKSSFY